MKLFFKRHCTSLAHTHNTQRLPTPCQLIHLLKSGTLSDAIKLLCSINTSVHLQNVLSKPILYATVVHSCTRSLHLAAGKQLHCHLIKSGLETDRFVGNSLLALYFKLGPDFNDTRKFFDGLRYKDVVSWSSMISGYIRAGKSRNAIALYLEMLDAGIEPNAFTFSAVIKASSEIGGFKLGKCLHGALVRCGFESNEVIVAALIDMYGRNGEASVARQLFDEMPEPDSICCTSVISALTRCDLYLEALVMFNVMRRKFGFMPDCFTYGSALTALGNLERLTQGREVHALIATGGFSGDVFVGSSLVDMYAKCGALEESRRALEEKNPSKRNMIG